ncbi:hypothetical protein HER21_28605 [Pseudomonas sp. BGM005]|nr:hypothetical protein [Pseudomonas sp. BG5]
MHAADIARLEAHVLQGSPGCAQCQPISRLTGHVLELQKFVIDLAAHHAAPGPTPEKLAEHYQLVARAKTLSHLIETPSPTPRTA